MAKETKLQDTEAEAPIHGDILSSILTHVPLIDLVPACHVSQSWKSAVSTSLRHFNSIKPWLILHTQGTRPPHATTAQAYDPRSRVWVQIHEPSINHISALRSSHSTVLYMLSPSKFSFSFDPLHLKWQHVKAPLVWRTDPIVALIGHHVVIAGGACDFEDDPLAVEMYNLDTREWDTCQSMPAILKDSAGSTWLSVAVNSNNNKMYVSEKFTGVTFSFDPNTKAWQGPYNLRPDRNVYCSNIGFSNDRLILIGLIGDNENKDKLKSVKLWELNGESFESHSEIGEMPEEFAERLRGDVSSMSMIGVSLMGDFVFINNTWGAPEEVFLCELGGGASRWSSVRNVVVDDKSRLTERLVFTCSNVGLGDLHRAMMFENRKFTVKESL